MAEVSLVAPRTGSAPTRQSARAPRRAAGGGEDGQILLLSIGVVVIALGLVLALASAAQVHLERKRLYDLADQLSLSVADDMDRPTYYARQLAGDPADVMLTDDDVRSGVLDYLHDHPEAANGLHDVQVVEASAVDGGRTARVVLQARARPALVSWATLGRSGGITVTADAQARAD
jgi:hypothetical protein